MAQIDREWMDSDFVRCERAAASSMVYWQVVEMSSGVFEGEPGMQVETFDEAADNLRQVPRSHSCLRH